MPWNYILLFAFTSCLSYIVAGFCSYYAPVAVLCAAVTTMFMLFGLTVVACFMKGEMVGYLAGFATALFFTLLPLILFALIFPDYWMTLLIEGVLISLFSLYIIFDTRMIMNRYNYDEYIVAALMLYVDII